MSRISCSHSFEVLDLGTGSCTKQISSITTKVYDIRWIHNIHSLFTGICSDKSRYRERYTFSAQSVWAINGVAIYRGLTVINFNDFPPFRLTVYLALQSIDTQKSQTLPSQIYGLYQREDGEHKTVEI